MKKLTFEQNLEKYRAMKIELAALKATEMELRIELCDELGEGKAAGTHNFDEYQGFAVKMVSKLSYTVNKTILETIDLTEEEAECIRWKPELNLAKFKMSETDNLDEAVTIKTGAPTLTVELV